MPKRCENGDPVDLRERTQMPGSRSPSQGFSGVSDFLDVNVTISSLIRGSGRHLSDQTRSQTINMVHMDLSCLDELRFEDMQKLVLGVSADRITEALRSEAAWFPS